MLSDKSYTLLFILLLATLATMTYFKKWYILDKRNLFRQKLFWISILTPLFSFVYFGYFAWHGKTPVLSAHGYSRFYEISKFPLLLLASSVPLASIVNNIHRTIQTETQINTTEVKNAVDRYLSHEKNFIEKTKEILIFKLSNLRDNDGEFYSFDFHSSKFYYFTTDEIKISNPYLLYKKIYTKASMEVSSDFSTNPDVLNKIKESLNIINDTLSIKQSALDNNPASFMISLNRLSYNISYLLDLICANPLSHVYCKLKLDIYNLKTFTAEEQTLTEVLEATYHLSRKLIRLIYNEDIPHYKNIHNYIYAGEPTFNLRQHVDIVQPFSSQDWTDYVSKELSTIENNISKTTEKKSS